jgi:hypothetical protein
MALEGPDPLVKKDKEACLVDLSLETELRKKLSPVGLPDGESKGLANGMEDIVALQGGSKDGGSSGDDSSNNGFVFIGEALEEMVNKKRVDFKGVRQTNLHWRSVKQTTLRGVTISEQLRKRVKLLICLSEKVVKYAIKALHIDSVWSDGYGQLAVWNRTKHPIMVPHLWMLANARPC